MQKSKVKSSCREDPVVLRCQVALFCRSTNFILYCCKPSPFATVTFLENPSTNIETAMLELKPYGGVRGTTNARNTMIGKLTVKTYERNYVGV